jgi:hypothetical protein
MTLGVGATDGLGVADTAVDVGIGVTDAGVSPAVGVGSTDGCAVGWGV